MPVQIRATDHRFLWAIVVVIALIIVFTLFLTGALRFAIDTTLSLEVTDPADCPGKFSYIVSLIDDAEMGIEGKFIALSADGTELERLETDQNGRFSSSVSAPAEWCGSDILLKATFEGGLRYKNASSEYTMRVRKSTCEDGTKIGACSATRASNLCSSDATLVYDCSTCGCQTGLVCDDNECVTPETRSTRLISRLQESIVMINHTYGTSSGIILAYETDRTNFNHTFIITNSHVVQNAVSIGDVAIITRDRVVRKANAIFNAPKGIDLAIVDVLGSFGTPAHINHSRSATQGQSVIAMGSPLGLQGSVSKGIVSNFVPEEDNKNYTYKTIQTDAAINPGNSGGGLFLESDGQLIGLNTFKYFGAEGLGFAIDIRELEALPGFKSWPAWMTPKTCWDGTPYYACSIANPSSICLDDGELYAACSICGCPDDYPICMYSGPDEGFCFR